MMTAVIKFAQQAHSEGILACVLRFGQHAVFGFREPEPRDLDRLRSHIQHWIRHHYVRVLIQQDAVRGVLIAERAPDFWDPDRMLLQERVWWVDPELRSSRASARLWQQWQQDVQHYLQDGRCDVAIMSTQVGVPTPDLAARGWQAFETHWMRLH